ncbi:uncharacterized protein LOC131613356 [Vicia villosa]|uniref:uncharacterized protein LOC131613356 n=1 Tax=Vicia villosa TaxID=3911 RepID=UPI00273C4056|nr:uncharacterized protein LOC131613356 [Vicia villosa]
MVLLFLVFIRYHRPVAPDSSTSLSFYFTNLHPFSSIDLHPMFSSTICVESFSGTNNVHAPSNQNNGSSSNHNKGYQNDTLNPYFMHPNENAALILVTPLLNADNYHSWSRSMTMALRSNNKLHFINGALPRPSNEYVHSIAWDRCNTLIMSWLNNSVESEIYQSILWMETRSNIWKKLKDKFYHGDIFRISDI